LIHFVILDWLARPVIVRFFEFVLEHCNPLSNPRAVHITAS
jgi:hypothetical protein